MPWLRPRESLVWAGESIQSATQGDVAIDLQLKVREEILIEKFYSPKRKLRNLRWLLIRGKGKPSNSAP
jgi:hypothetical protein